MLGNLFQRHAAYTAIRTFTISENSQTLDADKIVACICSETQVYLAREFCFVFCCLCSRFFCMSFVAYLGQPIARWLPLPEPAAQPPDVSVSGPGGPPTPERPLQGSGLL